MQPPLTGKVSKDPARRYQHEADTAPFTATRHTSIHMPKLNKEQVYTALFVLDDDVTTEEVNGAIRKIADEEGDDLCWLANDTLQDVPDEGEDRDLPKSSCSSDWRSPFAGKTVQDAFEFLSSIPLTKKLMRGYILVLDKHLYNEKDWLVVYHIDVNGDITSIPCETSISLAAASQSYEHKWNLALEDWRGNGQPLV